MKGTGIVISEGEILHSGGKLVTIHHRAVVCSGLPCH